MKPARIDLVSFNNEVFETTVTIVYEDDGTALDLTGYSAYEMQVRQSEAHTVPSLSLSAGDGISVEGAATLGALTLFASEEDVTDLLGNYVYDLRATRDGKTEVILYGEIDFLQGKTYDLG